MKRYRNSRGTNVPMKMRYEGKRSSLYVISNRNNILYILDSILSLVVIPISSVVAWTSIYYVIETVAEGNGKIILIFGCVFLHSLSHLCCKFIYRCIREHVTGPRLFYIVSKLYIYIFALASIVIYGFVPEHYASVIPYSENPYQNTALTLISFVTLLCLRCRPHIASLGGDAGTESTPEEVFLFPFRFFKFSWKKNKLLYVLDSIFSVFIVGTLVILVWRGAWCLLDQVLFPENYKLSGWASLAIGYLIVFVTFLLKSLVKMLIRKYDSWRRLIILDIYVVISFCGTINIWRGIWILLEIYTDIENNLRNCILLHFLSFFILVIFNASNTLLVRGVYIDAEENVDDCVELPCYYFRLHFQEKEKKNVLAQLNELHMRQLRRTFEEEDSLKHPMVTEFIDQEPDHSVDEDKRPNNNSINSDDPDRGQLNERAIDLTLKDVVSAAEANIHIIPVPV